MLLTLGSGIPGYAQNIEAVQRRLVEAVTAGELSLEQAGKMMSALKESQIHDMMLHAKAKQIMAQVDVAQGDRREALAMELKQAVKAGKLSEKDAWAKWKLTKQFSGENQPSRDSRLGVPAAAMERIRNVLRERGLDDQQVRKTLDGLPRVVHAAISAGDEFELEPGLANYFAKEVGLSDEQVEMVKQMGRRLAYRHREFGHEEPDGEAR
jgi:hypothetical protein